jgi:signal transduction histidine kinase
VNPFRPSLRRSIALALLGMSLLGYLVVTTAWYFFSVARVSVYTNGGGCFEMTPFGGIACTADGPWPAAVRLTVYVLVLALLGAVWGLWRASGRILRPLHEMTEAVRRVGPQNPGQRIAMSGAGDELKDLADALDMALDQVVAGYEGQRRFAANASHELRTPLARFPCGWTRSPDPCSTPTRSWPPGTGSPCAGTWPSR